MERIVHNYRLSQVASEDVEVFDVDAGDPETEIATKGVFDELLMWVEEPGHLVDVVFLPSYSRKTNLRSRKNHNLKALGSFF